MSASASNVTALRVQKIIADSGMASRREAEDLIRDAEVTINGKIAKLGDKAIPGKDHIKVRGKLLKAPPEKVVIAFFKPRDVLTMPVGEEAQGRVTSLHSAQDFLYKVKEKLIPAGRLDLDAEGIVLFTNDGDLASRLTKSKFEIPKTYLVKVDGHVDEKKIKRIERGLRIEEQRVNVTEIKAVRGTEGKDWYRVTLTDSRNRVIRKIFEEVGHPVDKVKREAFAGIVIKGMERGQYRYLEPKEILGLRKLVGLA